MIMATISENLQIIKDSTDAIKQAIIDKGGNVSGGISTYADAISEISGSGGGDSIEYLDVRGLELGLKAPLAMYALAVRVKGADKYTMPIASLLISEEIPESVFGGVIAVMFDLSFVIDMGSDGKFETRELYALMGIDLSSLPRLTKEQFYTLE